MKLKSIVIGQYLFYIRDGFEWIVISTLTRNHRSTIQDMMSIPGVLSVVPKCKTCLAYHSLAAECQKKEGLKP